MQYFRQVLIVSLLALIAVNLPACAGPAATPQTPVAAPAVQPKPLPASTDLDGHPLDPLAYLSLRRATVLLFITNDCPISNSYAPEIHRLCDAYMKQGIAIYLVYSDSDLSLADVRKHYQDFGYKCPAVFDSKHELATKTGATVTPEAAVYLPNGQRVYRGRINDLYLDYGKARYSATTSDLKDVLESIAQNHPLPAHTTQAVGCPIPM
jgi:hypothetical protein